MMASSLLTSSESKKTRVGVISAKSILNHLRLWASGIQHGIWLTAHLSNKNNAQLNGKGEPFNFDVNQPIPKNKIFKDAKRSTRLNQTQELSIEDTSVTGRITHEVDLGIRPSRESFQQWNWDQTLLEGISPTNLGFNQPYKLNIYPIYIPYQSSCSYLRPPNMAILPGENCSAELVVAQENSSVGPWIKSLGPELPQKNLAKGCLVPQKWYKFIGFGPFPHEKLWCAVWMSIVYGFDFDMTNIIGSFSWSGTFPSEHLRSPSRIWGHDMPWSTPWQTLWLDLNLKIHPQRCPIYIFVNIYI